MISRVAVAFDESSVTIYIVQNATALKAHESRLVLGARCNDSVLCEGIRGLCLVLY